MSQLDHEFSYLCEGSEEAPHELRTAQTFGLNAAPPSPVCATCGQVMKVILPDEAKRSLTDMLRPRYA